MRFASVSFVKAQILYERKQQGCVAAVARDADKLFDLKGSYNVISSFPLLQSVHAYIRSVQLQSYK